MSSTTLSRAVTPPLRSALYKNPFGSSLHRHYRNTKCQPVLAEETDVNLVGMELRKYLHLKDFN